jgi:hypothetical protein
MFVTMGPLASDEAVDDGLKHLRWQLVVRLIFVYHKTTLLPCHFIILLAGRRGREVIVLA